MENSGVECSTAVYVVCATEVSDVVDNCFVVLARVSLTKPRLFLFLAFVSGHTHIHAIHFYIYRPAEKEAASKESFQSHTKNRMRQEKKLTAR